MALRGDRRSLPGERDDVERSVVAWCFSGNALPRSAVPIALTRESFGRLPNRTYPYYPL